MRKVAVLSFACAFLAVLSVAFAQTAPTKFTHYFAGGFTGADQRNGGAWVRHNTADGWVQLPTSTVLNAAPKKVVFHPADNNILFLLVSNTVDNKDYILKYDVTLQTYVTLGETLALGSVNDLFAVGDSLFIAGGSFGLAARDVTPTNIARRAIAADPRSHWEAFPGSLTQQIGQTVTTFVASGVAGGSPVALASTNNLYWQQTADGVWTNVAEDAGVNLRGPGGSATVAADYLAFSGGFIWARNSAGFTLSADTAVSHLVVRSANGRNWESVLPAATFAAPSEYSLLDSAFYDTVADGVYFFGRRTTTAAPIMSNDALFFVRRGQTSVAQVGDSFVNINPATTKLFRAGSRVFALHASTLVVYTESTNSEVPNYTQFRSKRRLLSGISAVDVTSPTAAWGAALGGGMGSPSVSESTPVAVSSDAANIYIGVSATNTWNVDAYGLAAMDSDGKLWPFGTPLREGNVDNVDDTAPTRIVRAVAHYDNDDGTTQTVIIGGNFRRYNNATLNSLAWADSSAPTTWNPFGNAGVAQPGGAVIPPSTSNYYDNPGNVYVLTYMPDPEARANARIVFVGGVFSQSGDVAINNIGRYYLKGSNTWSNMKGGVSNIDGSGAKVSAIDYIGRKVFVGGSFTRAGNVSALNIAMWDDEQNTWAGLGSGVSGEVYHILVRAENDVWVVGNFGVAGGVDITNIARWDGSTWTAVYCDRCDNGCEKGVTDGIRACPGISGVQLKNMNGRIHLATSSALYVYDGSKFRSYSSFASGANRQVLTTAPGHIEGGNNIMVATSRTVSSNIRSQLVIYNTDTHNYANYVHGGFSSAVQAVSRSSILAPVVFVTLIAALIATLL